LRLAGDSVGAADVGAVERLCAAFPENKFLCTMLARENQHALCVAARKFRNLHLLRLLVVYEYAFHRGGDHPDAPRTHRVELHAATQ
jgi:hypothetical protein